MAGIAGLVVVALAAAVLFVPRWLRPRRVAQRAGTAAVSPERIPAASGGMAVPAVHEVAFERKPYDSGCLLAEASGEEMVT